MFHLAAHEFVRKESSLEKGISVNLNLKLQSHAGSSQILQSNLEMTVD